MNDKSISKLTVGLLIAVVLITPLGCSADRWVEVEPGEYTVIDVHSDSNGAALDEIEKLIVERESNTITIILQGGSQLAVAFVARKKEDWPAGCPSNVGSTRMEVLDIQSSNLSIRGMIFDRPVLVRNCPPDPNTIVLRADGTIGGAGSACAWPEKDIHFSKNSTR